jgi:S1-C subfamily serine protease
MLKRSVRIVASIALAMSLLAWSSARAQDQKPMPPANPNQGYFGAKFSDINDEMAEKLGLDSQDGVVIMEVIKDSPAAKAGIKQGDVVKKLDDKPINAKEDFVTIMRASKPDQQLKVSIIREKQPQDLTVTLEKRPPAMDELDKQMQKERMEREKGNDNDNDHDKDKGPATKPN